MTNEPQFQFSGNEALDRVRMRAADIIEHDLDVVDNSEMFKKTFINALAAGIEKGDITEEEIIEFLSITGKYPLLRTLWEAIAIATYQEATHNIEVRR